MPLDGVVPQVQKAVESVCSAFDSPVSRVHSEKRDTRTVRLRWACWIVMNDRLDMSPTEIARAVGKDHTTVMHGLCQGRKILDSDPAWRAKVIEAGEGLTKAFKPPPETPMAGELDYIVLDRIVAAFRNAALGHLKSDPTTFREKYGSTYRRIREVAA